MPGVLISVEAGLGSMVPVPHVAADAASIADSAASRAGAVTAYVASYNAGTVTPIATATNTAGPPIPVGKAPVAIRITPDGKTVYVANYDSGTVTPIATATNTAGPPIRAGDGPWAIAVTPDG